MSPSAPMTEFTDDEDKTNLFSLKELEINTTKEETKPRYTTHLQPLGVSNGGGNILRIPSPDSFSEFLVEEDRPGRPLLSQPQGDTRVSKSPAPVGGVRGWFKAFWKRNKGLALVCLAQIFGTLMNVTTRILELEGNNGKGMHPFQVHDIG